MYIPLITQGYHTEIDEIDFLLIQPYRLYLLRTPNTLYVQCIHPINIRRPVMLHHIILQVPVGTLIDHRDTNGLNNTRSNLRIATHQQNQQARKGPTYYKKSCTYKGVYRGASKISPWIAHIRINGKAKHIGSFKTSEEAAIAYDKAAKEQYGDFAGTNF